MLESIPIASVIVSIVAVMFSLSVHEASHAGMAYLLDDDTAARMGRLTLNPIVHISLVGTILLPLVLSFVGLPGFGWAKPVPVNPANLTRKLRQRVAYALVAAAGPASNILLSLLFIILLSLVARILGGDMAANRVLVLQDAFSPAEKLLRDGLYPVGQVVALTLMSRLVLINLWLALFNLLPFGPLDGASVFRGFLSYRHLATFDRIQPTASIIVLVLFLAGGMEYVLKPLVGLCIQFVIVPVANLILGV